MRDFDTVAATCLRRIIATNRAVNLADDEDAGVRLAAAGKLLAKFPEDAEPVLEKLSLQKTLIGMSAAATLHAKHDRERRGS